MLINENQELEFQKVVAASDMFQLLALTLHLPQQELASGLLDGSIAEDVKSLLFELGIIPEEAKIIEAAFENIRLNGGSGEDLLSEMRREYTRLFTHPKRPAIRIYEALFKYKPEVDGGKPSLFINPTALDAEGCYKNAGLTMSRGMNESGDHMATEMEFMMYLYQQKAKALYEGDQERTAQVNEQIEQFSKSHLNKWAVDFFDQCASVSEERVYQTIGRIGSLFLRKILQG